MAVPVSNIKMTIYKNVILNQSESIIWQGYGLKIWDKTNDRLIYNFNPKQYKYLNTWHKHIKLVSKTWGGYLRWILGWPYSLCF